MIRRILLSVLCLTWLTACVDADAPVPALTQTARWQEDNASIVLSLPEDWAWNVFPETEEAEHLGGGIRFYPENDPTADTVIRFANDFGVCGTDLDTENITLSGGNKVVSYAWGGEEPSLYHFSDAPGYYLADLSLDDAQRKAHFDTVMQILGTAQLGGDVIRASTAVMLTGYEENEGTRILPEYDIERSIWVVEIYIKKNTGFRLWYTYEISADGQTVIKTYDINASKETAS